MKKCHYCHSWKMIRIDFREGDYQDCCDSCGARGPVRSPEREAQEKAFKPKGDWGKVTGKGSLRALVGRDLHKSVWVTK